MKENKFQKKLIKELRELGCDVLKNDSKYIQGIPDLLILYKNKWGMLECKKGKNSHVQPNQEYYINKFNKMSFAKFICPENKEEILNDLQSTFGLRRKTCFSKSKSKCMAKL